MNKKLNKTLSALLAFVMMFTAVAFLIPVKTSAAHSPSSVGSAQSLTVEEIKEIVKDSYTYTFNSAQEMLDYELSMGYLDYVHSAKDMYSLYVNRYTGAIYYKNNSTGEILLSNPYNIGSHTQSESVQRDLMSQVNVQFFYTAESSKNPTYTSSQWAAEYGQISVNAIKNGLRVNYTLGNTATRYLVPGRITAAAFEAHILNPMLAAYQARLEELLGETYPDKNFDFYSETKYGRYEVTVAGCVNLDAVKKYLEDTQSLITKLPGNSPEETSLLNLSKNLYNLFDHYVLRNPEGKSQTVIDAWIKEWEKEGGHNLLKEGIAVYAYKFPGKVKEQRADSAVIRQILPDYTFNEMYADEAECEYSYGAKEEPVFRLALEYTFNDDGSLSVRLPANSIVFDETKYTFQTISPLPYFGSGDVNEYGYIFLPDGSGSIIEYEDFDSLTLKLQVYGTDYCYSNISGKHTEQVTMPIYGMVSTMPKTATENTTTGFFAILEEGASLATIVASIVGSDHNYVSTHAEFTPFPSDEYDLSNTISVGASGSYTIVSESKYTGSYITRYVMLSGDEASYNGMAAYYREYLKAEGVIDELTEVYDSLPLYIEALGSMEKIEKILSFPVSVSVELTTFDDVAEMYRLLSDAKNEFIKEADRYQGLADAETENLTVKSDYQARADKYRALADEVYNINNINFKLTGFANDGMYFTYPVRVKWERCLGGKDGVNKLIETAKGINASGEGNFGLYPEFDFQYINNDTLFDGIGKLNNVSRMVDNRYASKQVYNTVLGDYESFFQMVISPDALDRLYTRFLKQYSKYDFSGLSVSTLGSDLNSNFDDKNPINRDQSQGYVEAILDRMAGEYDLIINKGNSYTIKYADHIVDMCIDSSHYTFSSYSVPFTGLVLHGYVNYTGGEMNYSGTPAYDLLHAIENGASLYYTLAMQNTELMKDDEFLNKYFGVDFKNWYYTLVQQYSELNSAIGGLQKYEIVKHETLIAERYLTVTERETIAKELATEYVSLVEKQIVDLVSDKFDELALDPANNGKGVKLTVDTTAIVAQAIEILAYLDLTTDNYNEILTDLIKNVNALAARYTAMYNGSNGVDPAVVSYNEVNYVSKYDYITDSHAADADYDKTVFSVDNHSVTMVTYKDPATGHEVVFILNYNIYDVDLVVDVDGNTFELTLGEYGYAKIEGGKVAIYG